MANLQDLVVIGGGSGGYAAAMRAAQLGGRVTLVEEARYGGNCMHRACIPSKFLMAAARLMGSIRRAERFGIRVGEPELDLDVLHERKDLLIESLAMGTEEMLSDYGVTLVEGQGRLASPDTVEVAGTQIEARNVVLATGSVAAQLSIDGVDLPGVIGTEEAIELNEIPARVAILGSQPWDLELAQYFCLMGSRVTLVEPGPQLLPEADREISQRVGKMLYDAGVAIQRGVAVEAIRQGADGALVVHLADGHGEVVADRVVAARRLPNSTGLGLRELGVRMENGAVLVDERLQTSVPHVFAVGDLIAGPMWSHKANAEGIVAAENGMGRETRVDYDVLPRCLYTWPQVAWVGLTEEQAEAQGLEIDVGKIPAAINPYAMILGETAGVVKVIACKRYGKILGAHVMAPGAVDLINAIAVAMLSEATVAELMCLIPAHPSLGEAVVDAAMDVERRSLHLPRW
jgi:dihydrolipoamide dehydrogenase